MNCTGELVASATSRPFFFCANRTWAFFCVGVLGGGVGG